MEVAKHKTEDVSIGILFASASSCFHKFWLSHSNNLIGPLVDHRGQSLRRDLLHRGGDCVIVACDGGGDGGGGG